MNTASTIVEREREYHNLRFAEETREAQEKYYFALSDCDAKYERLLLEFAQDATILDYGCAQGMWALRIAPVAKAVYGIDISDVAIASANEIAAEGGVANAHFSAMDAHEMSFADNTFDLVFGLGIIHHLETGRALEEVARVLKPGGVAVFREPLGYNLLINLYRGFTPAARTIDEHPLKKQDFRIAGKLFKQNHWEFYGLATLASVPFQRSGIGNAIYRITSAVDRALLRLPGVRWQSWSALIVLTK